MRGRLPWIVAAVLALLAPLRGQGQESMPYNWRHYMEVVSEEGSEEDVQELAELYAECLENPVNVNDTACGLRIFPFVSSLQISCLKAHVALYGRLATTDELYGVEGFDSATVELLKPLIFAGPSEQPKPVTLKEILTQGRHNLIVGAGGTVEQARGYRDSIYEGDNLRLLWRYVFKYKDRVQLQLSGDKDPGEAFFSGSQRQGFDFYGYSLMVNDIGKVKKQRMGLTRKGKKNQFYLQRAVAGQYHLQFGQGLTLWSGYSSFYPMGTNISRFGVGLRPNGAFTEYGYLRGAAATLSLASHWSLTAFYSLTDRSATLPRKAATDSTIDWVQSLYNSGYYRTQTELKKKHQVDEQLFGGHLSFHTRNLTVGLTGVSTRFSKEIIPQKYVYNDNAFRGRGNANFGLDFAYRYRRLLLFGEGAVCVNTSPDSSSRNVSPAAIAGMEFIVNNNHRLSASLRYYSPTYHNLHASCLGQNGYPQNEEGAGVNYQGLLLLGIQATASADWFRFPHMKYLVYAPSVGQEYNLALARPFRHVKGLTLRLSFRYKEKARNVTPTHQENGSYVLEQTYRRQLQGEVAYENGIFKLVTRVAYAHYHGEVTQVDKGLLFYQDVQLRPQRVPLTMAARITLFDIDDYEARLYTMESGFIYQSNSVVFQNEGWRCYLLLKWEVTEHWNIGFKYGVTVYTDKDSFGSGYELISVPHRQQWRIQMRLKW